MSRVWINGQNGLREIMQANKPTEIFLQYAN
jgi:hypothetical protein